VLYIQELTYKDDAYIIRWFEDGAEIKKTYKYLMKYEGEPESETALYESYLRFLASDMPFPFVNVKDYTDGRAKQIIEYIKTALQKSDSIEFNNTITTEKF